MLPSGSNELRASNVTDVARRRQDVVAGARHWRRVDHHLGLVVVDGFVLIGVVAHRETDVIDAGLVECVAHARASSRSRRL